MVWSPFSGTEYPYNWSPLTPYAGQARFLEVDTNKDGKLDGQDDPFSPYYPGDSYVDWVGMSIFYPGKEFMSPLSHDQFQMDVKPTVSSTATAAPTATSIPQIPKYQQQISANNNFESQLTNAGRSFNFYQMFAVGKSKPFLISSGAAYLQGPDVEPEPLELPFKSSWITQILNRSILEKYPWIKGLLFYNAVINVSETNYNGWFKFDSRTTVDYTLTRNASVLGFMRNRIDNLTAGNSVLLNHD